MSLSRHLDPESIRERGLMNFLQVEFREMSLPNAFRIDIDAILLLIPNSRYIKQKTH